MYNGDKVSSERTIGRRSVLGGIGATSVAALSGIGSGSESGSSSGPGQARDDEYVEGVTREPRTDNVLVWDSSPSGRYVDPILDGTYTVTPDGEVFPLWTDVETDDDQVFVFELRDGLRWGGGYGAVTAEDFVRTIETLFLGNDPDYDHSDYSIWADYDDLRVSRWDDDRFAVELSDPDPWFLRRDLLRRRRCVPASFFDEFDPGEFYEMSVPRELGNGTLGPYRFESWSRGDAYRLRRNPDYYLRDANVPDGWREAPWYDRATIRVVRDGRRAAAAIAGGDVTTAEVSIEVARNFEHDDGVSIAKRKQPYITSLFFNMRANGWLPFRDADVRRGFATAIDKSTLLENGFGGYHQVTHTLQPEWSPWYEAPDSFGEGRSYDPVRARERIEAGLTGTEYTFDGGRLVDGGGAGVTLTLVSHPAGPRTFVAEYVANHLQELGIGVEVELVDFQLLYENYMMAGNGLNGGHPDEATSNADWDLMVNSTLGSSVRRPGRSKEVVTLDGEYNFPGYQPDADLEAMYAEAASLPSLPEMRQRYRDIYATINREQPMAFLFSHESPLAFSSDVTGPADGPNPHWNAATWRPADGKSDAGSTETETETETETPTQSTPEPQTETVTATETATDEATDEIEEETTDSVDPFGGEAETETPTESSEDADDATATERRDRRRTPTEDGALDLDETPGFGLGLSGLALGLAGAGAAGVRRLREDSDGTDGSGGE